MPKTIAPHDRAQDVLDHLFGDGQAKLGKTRMQGWLVKIHDVTLADERRLELHIAGPGDYWATLPGETAPLNGAVTGHVRDLPEKEMTSPDGPC